MSLYEERGSPTPDTVGTTTARSTERMEVIKRVEPQETAGGGVPLSLDYRFMGSVWRVGAIEDNRGMLHPFYVSAPQDVCGLITVTIGMGEDLPHAEDAWPCPQDRGAITIEDATGPTDIVTFTDTLSRTGTFDLSTPLLFMARVRSAEAHATCQLAQHPRHRHGGKQMQGNDQPDGRATFPLLRARVLAPG